MKLVHYTRLITQVSTKDSHPPRNACCTFQRTPGFEEKYLSSPGIDTEMAALIATHNLVNGHCSSVHRFRLFEKPNSLTFSKKNFEIWFPFSLLSEFVGTNLDSNDRCANGGVFAYIGKVRLRSWARWRTGVLCSWWIDDFVLVMVRRGQIQPVAVLRPWIMEKCRFRKIVFDMNGCSSLSIGLLITAVCLCWDY